MLLYICPERAGIPGLGRDCHSSLGYSGDNSIRPPLGCQPRSPECSTTIRSPLCAHARLSRTPWVSQPDSPQVRSGTSEMSHFSLGYTKWRRSCASPDYTDLQSNFPQTLFGMDFTFSTLNTSYTSKYQPGIYNLPSMNNTFYRL